MKLDTKDKLIAELLDQINKLEQLVEAQAEKIRSLEAKLKKNSRNSSKPLFSDGLKSHLQNLAHKEKSQVKIQEVKKGIRTNVYNNITHLMK